MANYVSNYAKEAWLQGDVDLDADDIRVLLVKSTYDGDVDDKYLGDTNIATSELSGTGYVRKSLGTPGSDFYAEVDLTNDLAVFKVVTDVTWDDLHNDNGDIEACIIYKYNASDSLALIIAYLDQGGFPFTTNDEDFTIHFHADGVFSLA